ncbi:MAG: PilZ domain-containing protein [Candidatus Omnitrophota bacterium]
MWDGINRRRFPRINYPCYIRVRKKQNLLEFLTKTENISCGGIAVNLPKNLGLFEEVRLKMDLKDSQLLVECDGTIVWVVKNTDTKDDKDGTFDTGIEFKSLKKNDETRIEAIVQSLIKDEE